MEQTNIIKKTILEGAFQRLQNQAVQTAEAVAKLDPKSPGYAWQVAQRSLDAAVAQAKAEGYEQAIREIFGMLEASP